MIHDYLSHDALVLCIVFHYLLNLHSFSISDVMEFDKSIYTLRYMVTCHRFSEHVIIDHKLGTFGYGVIVGVIFTLFDRVLSFHCNISIELVSGSGIINECAFDCNTIVECLNQSVAPHIDVPSITEIIALIVMLRPRSVISFFVLSDLDPDVR